MYLIVIGRNPGDKEIANNAADGNDECCPNVDEQLSCSMTNKELGRTPHHQIERLGC